MFPAFGLWYPSCISIFQKWCLWNAKRDSAQKYWTAITDDAKPVTSNPNNLTPMRNDNWESNRTVLYVWLLFVYWLCIISLFSGDFRHHKSSISAFQLAKLECWRTPKTNDLYLSHAPGGPLDGLKLLSQLSTEGRKLRSFNTSNIFCV